jgi:hypothetical protein
MTQPQTATLYRILKRVSAGLEPREWWRRARPAPGVTRAPTAPVTHGEVRPARECAGWRAFRANRVLRVVLARHRAETEAGLEFGVRRVAGADCGRSVVAAVSARKRGCLSWRNCRALRRLRRDHALPRRRDRAHGLGLGAGLQAGAARDCFGRRPAAVSDAARRVALSVCVGLGSPWRRVGGDGMAFRLAAGS